MKLLTVSDVADLMQVTEGHVRLLCQEGQLPAIKVAGQWRITPYAYRQYVGLPNPERDPAVFSFTVTGTDFHDNEGSVV